MSAAVRPGSASAWLLAARPRTLTAGAVPVAVGTAVAYAAGSWSALLAAAALVVCVGIQVGTNLVNDWADWRSGADSNDRVGPVRVTSAGLLSPRAVLAGAVVSFAVASAAGLVIAADAGWIWLAVGAGAIVCGIAYTAGPLPLGYVGLGDVFAFAGFGVVATAATAAVQTGHVSYDAVALGAAVGLFAAALLGVNNLRDVRTDMAAGKRTLAVLLGVRAARTLVLAELAVALVIPVLVLGVRGLPALAAAVALVDTSRRVARADADAPTALLPALGGIARAEAVFGVLVVAGVLWPR